MKRLLDISSIRWSCDGISNPLEFLKLLNPMQIIKPKIPLNVFEIRYKYTTSRGNRKDGIKYFLVNTINPEQNCEILLKNWVNDYNKANKHREISNVKFLDSALIMSLEI